MKMNSVQTILPAFIWPVRLVCKPTIAANEHYMQLKHHSPNYYIRRRLLKNYPAMVGLVVIIIATLIAVLGYTIMPDDSPNANDGAIQLQKQLPGFSAKVLKIRKNAEIEDNFWLEELAFGQPSAYLLEPILDYRVEGLKVFVTPYGGEQEKQFDLVNVVLPLFVGEHQLKNFPPDKSYVEEADAVRYINLEGREERITKAQLLEQLEEEHVEER